MPLTEAGAEALETQTKALEIRAKQDPESVKRILHLFDHLQPAQLERVQKVLDTMH